MNDKQEEKKRRTSKSRSTVVDAIPSSEHPLAAKDFILGKKPILVTNTELQESKTPSVFSDTQLELEQKYTEFMNLVDDYKKSIQDDDNFFQKLIKLKDESKKSAHDNFIQKVITDNERLIKTTYEKLEPQLSKHTPRSNNTEELIKQSRDLISKIHQAKQAIDERRLEQAELENPSSVLYQLCEAIKTKIARFSEVFKTLSPINIALFEKSDYGQLINIIEHFHSLVEENASVTSAVSLNDIYIDDLDYVLSLINKSIAQYQELDKQLRINNNVMLDKTRCDKNKILLDKAEEELRSYYNLIIDIIQNKTYHQLEQRLNLEKEKFSSFYKDISERDNKHANSPYFQDYQNYHVEFNELKNEFIRKIEAIRKTYSKKDQQMTQTVKDSFKNVLDMQRLRIDPNRPLRKQELYTELTQTFIDINKAFDSIKEREKQCNELNANLKKLRLSLQEKLKVISNSPIYKNILPHPQANPSKPNHSSIAPLPTLDSFIRQNTAINHAVCFHILAEDIGEMESFVSDTTCIAFSYDMKQAYKSYKDRQERLIYQLNKNIASINNSYLEKINARIVDLSNETISTSFNKFLHYLSKELRVLRPTKDATDFFEQEIDTFIQIDSIVLEIIEAYKNNKLLVASNASSIQTKQQQLQELRSFSEKLSRISEEILNQPSNNSLVQLLQIELKAAIGRLNVEIRILREDLDASRKLAREQSQDVQIIAEFIKHPGIGYPIIITLKAELQRAIDAYVNQGPFQALDENWFRMRVMGAINTAIDDPDLKTILAQANQTEKDRDFWQAFNDFLVRWLSWLVTVNPNGPTFFQSRIENYNQTLEACAQAQAAHNKFQELREAMSAPAREVI